MAFNLFRKKSPPSEAADRSAAALSPEDQALAERAAQYGWYHRIALNQRVSTRPQLPELEPLWNFVRRQMDAIDFRGKRVLDIGCRDGLFSFEAERRGAAEVLAIDNDLSPGLREFLIPHFASAVRLESLNLYDLDPQRHGPRDVILFLGVLYHLRYPVWGLRKIIDCLAPDGVLLIESGMLEDSPDTRDLDLLYCPVEESPYEPTSCTFFNRRGLETTMRSLGMTLQAHAVHDANKCGCRDGRHVVNRQVFRFRRTGFDATQAGINLYWNETHAWHSVEAKPKGQD